jgi:hypothetical protein
MVFVTVVRLNALYHCVQFKLIMSNGSSYAPDKTDGQRDKRYWYGRTDVQNMWG